MQLLIISLSLVAALYAAPQTFFVVPHDFLQPPKEFRKTHKNFVPVFTVLGESGFPKDFLPSSHGISLDTASQIEKIVKTIDFSNKIFSDKVNGGISLPDVASSRSEEPISTPQDLPQSQKVPLIKGNTVGNNLTTDNKIKDNQSKNITKESSTVKINKEKEINEGNRTFDDVEAKQEDSQFPGTSFDEILKAMFIKKPLGSTAPTSQQTLLEENSENFPTSEDEQSLVIDNNQSTMNTEPTNVRKLAGEKNAAVFVPDVEGELTTANTQSTDVTEAITTEDTLIAEDARFLSDDFATTKKPNNLEVETAITELESATTEPEVTDSPQEGKFISEEQASLSTDQSGLVSSVTESVTEVTSDSILDQELVTEGFTVILPEERTETFLFEDNTTAKKKGKTADDETAKQPENIGKSLLRETVSKKESASEDFDSSLTTAEITVTDHNLVTTDFAIATDFPTDVSENAESESITDSAITESADLETRTEEHFVETSTTDSQVSPDIILVREDKMLLSLNEVRSESKTLKPQLRDITFEEFIFNETITEEQESLTTTEFYIAENLPTEVSAPKSMEGRQNEEDSVSETQMESFSGPIIVTMITPGEDNSLEKSLESLIKSDANSVDSTEASINITENETSASDSQVVSFTGPVIITTVKPVEDKDTELLVDASPQSDTVSFDLVNGTESAVGSEISTSESEMESFSEPAVTTEGIPEINNVSEISLSSSPQPDTISDASFRDIEATVATVLREVSTSDSGTDVFDTEVILEAFDKEDDLSVTSSPETFPDSDITITESSPGNELSSIVPVLEKKENLVPESVQNSQTKNKSRSLSNSLMGSITNIKTTNGAFVFGRTLTDIEETALENGFPKTEAKDQEDFSLGNSEKTSKSLSSLVTFSSDDKNDDQFDTSKLIRPSEPPAIQLSNERNVRITDLSQKTVLADASEASVPNLIENSEVIQNSSSSAPDVLLSIDDVNNETLQSPQSTKTLDNKLVSLSNVNIQDDLKIPAKIKKTESLSLTQNTSASKNSLTKSTDPTIQANATHSAEIDKTLKAKPQESSVPNKGKSIQPTPNRLGNLLVAKHFGFKNPSSVIMAKPKLMMHHGTLVDPKTLVPPQFRSFIFENDLPEVTAAKVAFFRAQAGLIN